MRSNTTSFDFNEASADRAFATSLGLSLRSLGRQVARLPAAIGQIRTRARAMAELAQMSDAELQDIGISRSEIPHLFDRRR